MPPWRQLLSYGALISVSAYAAWLHLERRSEDRYLEADECSIIDWSEVEGRRRRGVYNPEACAPLSKPVRLTGKWYAEWEGVLLFDIQGRPGEIHSVAIDPRLVKFMAGKHSLPVSVDVTFDGRFITSHLNNGSEVLGPDITVEEIISLRPRDDTDGPYQLIPVGPPKIQSSSDSTSG